jgi:agmatinase
MAARLIQSVGFYCAGGPAAIRAAGAAYAANLAHMNFDLGGPVFPGGVSAVDAGDLPQDRPIRAATGRGSSARSARFWTGAGCRCCSAATTACRSRCWKPMARGGGVPADRRAYRLAAAKGWACPTMRRWAMEAIIQVGQRGIGSARVQDVADADGAWGSFRRARSRAMASPARSTDCRGGDEVIICLDLDALDPSVMPAVIGRTVLLAPGAAPAWPKRPDRRAFDMVEFMPDRDIDGQGAPLRRNCWPP